MTDIASLRALLAAATPRPWVAQTEGNANQKAAAAAAFLAVMARCDPDCPDIEWSDLSYVLTPDGSQNVALTGNGPRATHNAAFIVGAVNALPALLDVAEAARDTVDDLDGIYSLRAALARWEEVRPR